MASLLEVGRRYKRADGKPFPFNYNVGVYIGLTPGEKMPRFILNVEKGVQCFVNAEGTTDNFISLDLSTAEKEESQEMKLMRQYNEAVALGQANIYQQPKPAEKEKCECKKWIFSVDGICPKCGKTQLCIGFKPLSPSVAVPEKLAESGLSYKEQDIELVSKINEIITKLQDLEQRLREVERKR